MGANVSSVEQGCLSALSRAAERNRTYRGKYRLVPVQSESGDYEQACIEALQIIGSANAKKRIQIEERKRGNK